MKQVFEIDSSVKQIEALAKINALCTTMRIIETERLIDYVKSHQELVQVGEVSGRILYAETTEDYESLQRNDYRIERWLMMDNGDVVKITRCENIDSPGSGTWSEPKHIDVQAIPVAQLESIAKYLKASLQSKFAEAAKTLA
jgi:hypothetical protein